MIIVICHLHSFTFQNNNVYFLKINLLVINKLSSAQTNIFQTYFMKLVKLLIQIDNIFNGQNNFTVKFFVIPWPRFENRLIFFVKFLKLSEISEQLHRLVSYTKMFKNEVGVSNRIIIAIIKVGGFKCKRRFAIFPTSPR